MAAPPLRRPLPAQQQQVPAAGAWGMWGPCRRIRTSSASSMGAAAHTWRPPPAPLLVAHRPPLRTRTWRGRVAAVVTAAAGASSAAGAAAGKSSGGGGSSGSSGGGGVCRLKLTVAYDGTNFAGMQWQAGNVRTVQGELEKAAARVLLTAGRVVGASRTDGGAHAAGQVAHLDVRCAPAAIQPQQLLLYLNGVLPDDVKVTALELAPPGFDSHFKSVGKEYYFRLSSGMPDPLQAKRRWWVYQRWCERSRGQPTGPEQMLLNVGAMQEAADLLVGTHDFSAFMDKKRPAGVGALKRKRPKLAELGVRPERSAEKNTRTLWWLRIIPEGGSSSDSTGGW